MDAAHRGSVAFTERGLDPVQARGEIKPEEPAAVHRAAAAGVQESGGRLPHHERIQAAFGAHDLGGVQAHVGGAARDASERIGAEAYAVGERVAFRGSPDLHTAAHEAAHVVQQRAGVALAGGVGQAGDAYEQHADAVAERVVRGESAAELLDQAVSSGAAPGGAGVQRRSPPDARAGEEEAQDIAGAAADELETILEQPSPVAGVGDPAQALRALEAMPLGNLLATLDEMDVRGRLSEIQQAMEHAPVRVERLRTALLIRDMARLPSVRADGAPLRELALALERLPDDERHGAFEYMADQRGLSRSVRAMIEGFLATESADAPMMKQPTAQGEEQPGPAAGSLGAKGASAGMPAPIGPGPWAPPGKQPPWFYVGNKAHEGIAEYYESRHPGEAVYKNFYSLASLLKQIIKLGMQADSTALDDQELAREPDIANLTLRHIFEIRPEAQLAAAEARVAMYLALFQKAGVSMFLGPTTDPGVKGALPAPDGVFLFWSPSPGVILYRYRKGTLVPVPVPVPERQGQEKPAREWRWELEPLSRVQEQALLTGAAGAIMLILMMMLLAPAGV